MSPTGDFDDVLRGWLVLGPDHAPDRPVSAALDRIATTRQRRSVLPWVRGGVEDPPNIARAVVMVGAGVLLAVTVGVGIGIQIADTLRIIDPSPTVPPPASAARMTYGYRAAGFQITLDGAWNVTSRSDPSTLTARFGGLRLFITSSDTEGRLRVCDAPAGPWLIEDCGPHELGDDELLGDIRPLGGALEEVQMDGEPASLEVVRGYEYPARGAQTVARVLAMHDGRAFVIRVWSPGDRIEIIDDIIRSFRFVDAGGASFRTSDPNLQLQQYESRAGGYRLLLPRAWIASAEEDEAGRVRGSVATEFRHPTTDGAPPLVLSIAVGGPEGMSLGELADELTSAGCSDYGELTEFTFLGTEQAMIEWPERGMDCLGFPGYRYHVFTIHDGRPVVLAFDYWFIEFGEAQSRSQGWAMVQAIIDSFEFIDD
jgi:hypothetical protein